MPFFSPDFCHYLLDLAETHNGWSKGIFHDNEYDPRIRNVENVPPTQDIHLKDLQLHDFWQHVVSHYFKKIMNHLYSFLVKECHIAFIVKYDHDGGQTSLSPHHDSSVYTINIALNDSDEYMGVAFTFYTKKFSFSTRHRGTCCCIPDGSHIITRRSRSQAVRDTSWYLLTTEKRRQAVVACALAGIIKEAGKVLLASPNVSTPPAPWIYDLLQRVCISSRS
jgi:hypothetical protein